MLRNTLSVIIGLVSSFIVIQVIEFIGYKMYPPTTALNFNNPDSFKEYVSSAPTAVFILIIIGYALGSLCGAFVASVVAVNKKMSKAITVGGILMGLGAVNLFSIPHPVWMIVAALVVFLPFAYLGGKLGLKVSGNKTPPPAAGS